MKIVPVRPEDVKKDKSSSVKSDFQMTLVHFPFSQFKCLRLFPWHFCNNKGSDCSKMDKTSKPQLHPSLYLTMESIKLGTFCSQPQNFALLVYIPTARRTSSDLNELWMQKHFLCWIRDNSVIVFTLSHFAASKISLNEYTCTKGGGKSAVLSNNAPQWHGKHESEQQPLACAQSQRVKIRIRCTKLPLQHAGTPDGLCLCCSPQHALSDRSWHFQLKNKKPAQQKKCRECVWEKQRGKVSISNLVTTSRWLFLVERKSLARLKITQPSSCWPADSRTLSTLASHLTDWWWVTVSLIPRHCSQPTSRERAGLGHLLWMISALEYHEQIAPSLLFTDRLFSFFSICWQTSNRRFQLEGKALAGWLAGSLAGGAGGWRWQESYSSSSGD